MLEPQAEFKTKAYYKRYSNHWRAVGICWAILTICFLIINIIVFIEPQWIGDSDTSPGTGWIGLYEYCELFNSGSNQICEGMFQDFSTIMSDAFRASTFFIGVSILIIFLCIFCFLIFFFKSIHKYGYIVCGSLQAVSTVFMFLGCVIFPHGWDHIYVQRICGDSGGPGHYNIGQCTFRWAYMLAIIGIFVILILTILAFVLAAKDGLKMKEYGAQSVVEPSKAGSVIIAPAQQATLQSNMAASTRTVGSRRQLQSEPGYAAQPYYADDSMKGTGIKYSDYNTTDSHGSRTFLVRDAGYTGRRHPDSTIAKQSNGSF